MRIGCIVDDLTSVDNQEIVKIGEQIMKFIKVLFNVKSL